METSQENASNFFLIVINGYETNVYPYATLKELEKEMCFLVPTGELGKDVFISKRLDFQFIEPEQ